MKSSEMKAQVRACLTSDLDETARLVWLYMSTVPVGVSAGTMMKAMKLEWQEVADAVAILEEAGLCRGRAAPGSKADAIVWEALQFRVKKPAKVRASSTAADTSMSLSRAALRVFRTYQERRVIAGHGHWTLTARSRADLLELVQRLDQHPTVEFSQFLNFAVREYKAFAGYPTPAHLKGDWIWDKWVNAATTERASARKAAETGHAGKHYGDPSWARGHLRKLGHVEAGRLNDAGVTYIFNRAKEVVDFASEVSSTDEWRQEILDLAVVVKEAQDAGTA